MNPFQSDLTQSIDNYPPDRLMKIKEQKRAKTKQFIVELSQA